MEQQRSKKVLTRRSLLKASLLAVGGTSLAAIGTAYYAKEIEPVWFETTHLQLVLPHLTNAFQGYRIIHISDLHTDDTWMLHDRLVGIVTQVNALKPDMIVITGDFVDHYTTTSQYTLSALSDFHAPDGVFGVLGNHDHPAGAERIGGYLQENNIRQLANATYTLKRGDQMLHLVGMDDLWPTNRGRPASIWTHQPLLKQLTNQIPAEGAAILLVHEPDFADVTATFPRYDLQLSGHSHGGQVRIPFRGPLFLPPLSRVYPMGLYTIGKLQLYTSRGLGMAEPHYRLDCRPEIAIIELNTRSQTQTTGA